MSGLPNNIVPISIGSVSDIEEGDEVFAIGHPEGFTWSFTTGIVSKIRKIFPGNILIHINIKLL